MILLLPLLTWLHPLHPRTRFGVKILFAVIMVALIKVGLLMIVAVLMGPHWSWTELGRGGLLLGASYTLHVLWRCI